MKSHSIITCNPKQSKDIEKIAWIIVEQYGVPHDVSLTIMRTLVHAYSDGHSREYNDPIEWMKEYFNNI